MAPTSTWLRSHPRLGDAIAALLVAVAELIQAATITTSAVNDDVVEPRTLFHWALVALTPVCIMIRRQRPLFALAAGTVATMTMWLLDLPITGLSGMFVLYGAVVYGPKVIGLRAAITSAVSLILFTLLGYSVGSAPFYVLPLVAWTTIMPILLAVHHTTAKELVAITQNRLVDAQHRRSADEAAAIQAERTRVARELHDVVAHGLSLIVVQTGAASRLLKTADANDLEATNARVATVIDTIDGAARASLQDMRHVLGVLRNPDAAPGSDTTDWRPTPGVENISELVDQVSAEGLATTLNFEGDTVDLPSAVTASAYRIVQEALTNVRKHAGPSVAVEVTISFLDTELGLTISDDGRGASTFSVDAANLPGGHGLIGMQERVEILGGTFHAGPRVGGGFIVKATLPFHADSTGTR